jgi:AcrR family transcriptional regulator
VSPAAKSSDAESRILAAALEVFGTAGFTSGSLNDIAVAAGLTRAGVLHYFPSKRAILLALLEKRDRDVRSTMPPPEVEHSLLELLDDASRWTEVIIGTPTTVRLAHLLTAEASSPDHPAHEWVRDRLEQLRRAIGEAVRVSVARGEIRADLDPDAVATLFLSAVEGAENQWLIEPDAVDVERTLRTLRTLLTSSR